MTRGPGRALEKSTAVMYLYGQRGAGTDLSEVFRQFRSPGLFRKFPQFAGSQSHSSGKASCGNFFSSVGCLPSYCVWSVGCLPSHCVWSADCLPSHCVWSAGCLPSHCAWSVIPPDQAQWAFGGRGQLIIPPIIPPAAQQARVTERRLVPARLPWLWSQETSRRTIK